MTDRSPSNSPGSMPKQIGEYEVQRVLGAGGMATVYAALQRQPRRLVAIKVMRYPADAASAMHRFKREIEILGRLRHPYVAQVFDAGVHTDDGGSVPYFVMEYVPRAKTITQFATTRQLSLRNRLKLFIKVCAAVEHGHINKIIHRDLKPGNILIDEGGDPKIIDFGVARAAEFDMTGVTMHTEEGRIIGTIQYMAPEQLEPTRQDLGPSCDVYALGVLLYKLLTGRPPYDLKGLPVFTAAQVIREDDPPRPSTIKPELRGDLETIILKALAKDRARRYGTAGSFGRDLVRFLADKPIKARDAGSVYRLRLFVRRHRTSLIAAALVGIVLVAATGVIIQQQRTLRSARATTPPAAATVDATVPPARPAIVAPPPIKSDAIEPIILAAPAAPVLALAFSPSGEQLASASSDVGLIVWDVARQRQDFAARDHEAPIIHVEYSADGGRIATAADDGRIVIVNTATTGKDAILRHDCSEVAAVDVGPAGSMAAVCCGDMTVRLVREDGREGIFRGSAGAFTHVALSTDGRRVAAADRGVVSVWDSASTREINRFPAGRERLRGLAFDADGDDLVAITAGGAIRRWRVGGEDDRGSTFATGLAEVDVTGFDASGRRVALAGGGSLVVWDIVNARAVCPVIELEELADIGAVALTPDGRVAVGDAEGNIRVLDVTPTEE